MASTDKIIVGGWIGQCNKCGTVHGIDRDVTVTAYGVLLKPGVYMGIEAPPRLCGETNRSQVQRACPGHIIQVTEQDVLVSAWRIGGWSAVRDILVELSALAKLP